MENKADLALAYHQEGRNCAQAVLAACGAPFGLDEATAMKLACGLGGGMGGLGETCGAVSAAILVIGLAGDGADKKRAYAQVREFMKRFEERNTSTVCRELIKENGKRVCPGLIRDAAELLAEMI